MLKRIMGGRRRRPNKAGMRSILNHEPLETRRLLASDFGAGLDTGVDGEGACEFVCGGEWATMHADDAEQPMEQNRGRSGDVGVGVQQRPGRGWDTVTDEAASGATGQEADDAAIAADDTGVTRQNQRRGRGGGQQQTELTAAETESITFAREEEKLARDVYITLGEMWDNVVFDKIARSEQNHMDAVKRLIDKYDLEDPVVEDTVGTFTNPVLGQLYEALVGEADVYLSEIDQLGVEGTIAGGAASQLAALKIGAFIEELDILDLMRVESDISHRDVANVHDNLLRGSRNHLRAFVGQIEASGDTHQPVLMTGADDQLGDLDALYEQIVNADRETGKRRQGRGSERRVEFGHARVRDQMQLRDQQQLQDGSCGDETALRDQTRSQNQLRLRDGSDDGPVRDQMQLRDQQQLQDGACVDAAIEGLVADDADPLRLRNGDTAHPENGSFVRKRDGQSW